MMTDARNRVLALGLLTLLLPLTAQAAAPVASVFASKTSGKSPLLVFFDATATADPDTTKPIHHLTYCFDAGDGNTDTYALAGHKTTKKAQFCGAPIFAYVYESPGTHTMTLTVIDEQGNIDTETVDVTVSDWAASGTTCVANVLPVAGSGGCPSGADVLASSDFDGAVDHVFNSDGNNRALFLCGDNFAVSATVRVGDGQEINAYDTSGVVTDRRCRYNVTTGTPDPLFNVDDDDVRILGGVWTGTIGSTFVDIDNGEAKDSDNILIQNWNINITRRFMTESSSGQEGSAINENIGIFEINATDCGNNGFNCLYTSFSRLAIVGSVFDDALDGEHVVRLEHAEDCFIHNNKFAQAASTKHLLTLRGLDESGATGGITNRVAENCFVSDNHFIGNTSVPVQIGAANGTGTTANHRNHILERNYFTRKASPEQEIIEYVVTGTFSGTANNEDFSYRANLGNGDGAITARFFEGTGTRVEYFNNSWFTEDGNTFADKGDVCKNNLAWDNSGSEALTMFDTACTTTSNNWDADGKESGVSDLSVCPFKNCPPTSPADFAIKVTDPDLLADAGADVPYHCDFDSTDRAQGLAVGIGALEPGTSTVNCVAAAGGGLKPPPNPKVSDVTP